MHTDNIISQVVGCNIKELRKNAGYTTKQLAQLINKSEQQLHRYERGVSKIDVDTLTAVLKVLNVNIADFFTQLTGDEINADSTGTIFVPQNKYLNAKLVFEVETAGINY